MTQFLLGFRIVLGITKSLGDVQVTWPFVLTALFLFLSVAALIGDTGMGRIGPQIKGGEY